MCGRYTTLYTFPELSKLIQFICFEQEVVKRYNIAPTQDAPVIKSHEQGEKVLKLLRWGLIPSWAKDKKIGSSLINARAETILTKPSFRSAFYSRRCVVPISGFYEWQKIHGEGAHKQPYYITLKSGEPLLLAGLWETWESSAEQSIESFTIITTSANKLIKNLHDRMPVILNPKDVDIWLNPKTPQQTLLSFLTPHLSESMTLYPISSYVNSPRNEGPQCVEPITASLGCPITYALG